jgi:hypothetical protein
MGHAGSAAQAFCKSAESLSLFFSQVHSKQAAVDKTVAAKQRMLAAAYETEGEAETVEEAVEESIEDDDPADELHNAARAFGTEVSAAVASAPNNHYATVHESSLLEVRTRQLKALQQDYLRLHEHTLQQAQLYAEQQAFQAQAVAEAERMRDSMRMQLHETHARHSTARPALSSALQGCEKMLSRLAAVRSVDQLPGEMAAASAMLFEVCTPPPPPPLHGTTRTFLDHSAASCHRDVPARVPPSRSLRFGRCCCRRMRRSWTRTARCRRPEACRRGPNSCRLPRWSLGRGAMDRSDTAPPLLAARGCRVEAAPPHQRHPLAPQGEAPLVVPAPPRLVSVVVPVLVLSREGPALELHRVAERPARRPVPHAVAQPGAQGPAVAGGVRPPAGPIAPRRQRRLE